MLANLSTKEKHFSQTICVCSTQTKPFQTNDSYELYNSFIKLKLTFSDNIVRLRITKKHQMNLTKGSNDCIMLKTIILVAHRGLHKFIILICVDVAWKEI